METTLTEKEQSEIVSELQLIRKEKKSEFGPVAEKHLQTVRISGNRTLEMDILFQLCLYHAHVTTQFETSNSYAIKCLEIARELEDYVYEAKALRMAGVNYQFLGELDKARQAYDEAIRILEQRSELSNDDKEILGGIYFNSVALYKDSELDDARLGYIDKSYRLYTEINSEAGIARAYVAYANQYPGVVGTEQALEYYKSASRIFSKIGDERSHASCLIYMGYQLCKEGDFTKGMPLVKEGIAEIEKSGNNIFNTNAYFYLARCLRLQKQFEEAIRHYSEVEKFVLSCHSKLNLADLYEEWALALEEAGDYKGSLMMYKKYISEKVRAIRLDKTSALNEAKTKYELEEKKREADFLRRKNADIEEYNRKLQTSNFELKQFAHVASHDLKEPLRMVTLYVQLLEKNLAHKLGESDKQYLQFAKEGAHRMYSLINGLLAYTNIHPEINTDEVDLNKVVLAIREILKNDIETRNFKIVAEELPVVQGNKTHLKLLFQNLILNAIYFNSAEEPRVEITCEKKDSNFTFNFCDNGIGVPEPYRIRVFEIFQRLNTRHQYPGTGIGLTICKKIVEQMNGKIWIEDGMDGGCNFRFTIPG